jgi:CBS domain containing-hemolysin-like protein
MQVFRLAFGLPARSIERIVGLVLPRPAGQDEPGEDGEGEELLRLVELQEGNGGGENGELAIIRRVANMVDTTAREIMVPRIDMVAAEATSSVNDVRELIVQHGFSRIPVYEERVDNIVGVVYAKDILRWFGQEPNLRALARPPYVIPEGKHIDELLTELQEQKVHMAIVVDEYGGTAGLVTIEDILEEIVGEIQDEYDREEATIQRLTDTEAVLDARVSVDALNEMFNLEIASEDFDTLGGFVYHELGRMPAPGDEVHSNGITLRVLSILGRRIKKVRVTKRPVAAGEAPPEQQVGG